MKIILFDGVCNLCNSSVQYIIEHDANHVFRFAASQSDIAQQLIATHRLQAEDLKSVIFVDEQKIYLRSDAALRIASYFGGAWPIFARIALFVPRFLRNGVYNIVAANRYRWFGQQKSCWIPTPELKSRFLS